MGATTYETKNKNPR
uniref:Uncharacterized protein n=1 Tax=Arundo donax TaxID=35708 RepID=A0A0A9G3U5_ARUDO